MQNLIIKLMTAKNLIYVTNGFCYLVILFQLYMGFSESNYGMVAGYMTTAFFFTALLFSESSRNSWREAWFEQIKGHTETIAKCIELQTKNMELQKGAFPSEFIESKLETH